MATEALHEAQQRLNEAGYGDDLVATGTRLRNVTSGEELDPATLMAAEITRFEPTSDPGDQALLVAVATRGGEPIGTFTVPYGPDTSPEEAEILRHLHRFLVSPEEAAAHDAHDHIAAVLPSQTSAEAAVDELHEIGMGSRHLGIAVHGPTSVVFEHDEEKDMARDAEVGVATGALVGFAGGLLLFAIAVPGIGVLGAGGLAALGASGAFGGAMLGGYVGMAAAAEEFDEHDALRHTPLEPGEVLIVACSHDRPELVEDAFKRHGGRIVEPGIW